ncbi:hypothetical protein QFC22_005783 [Naganishia vaughanmartiniae]|uniref:Uncharacterized protein n=1 Tax=Naganishia vaughanmartiniae TaxID=1424756 RepID=A0ACC2WT99_9TREE|nr:hypothetical protein QFC22_005783 [Naganishia vaughanmartiniae]
MSFSSALNAYRFPKATSPKGGATSIPYTSTCPGSSSLTSATASQIDFEYNGSNPPSSEESNAVITPLSEIEHPELPSIACGVSDDSASVTNLYGSSVGSLAAKTRDLDCDIASPEGWIHHVMRMDRGKDDESIFGNYCISPGCSKFFGGARLFCEQHECIHYVPYEDDSGRRVCREPAFKENHNRCKAHLFTHRLPQVYPIWPTIKPKLVRGVLTGKATATTATTAYAVVTTAGRTPVLTSTSNGSLENLIATIPVSASKVSSLRRPSLFFAGMNRRAALSPMHSAVRK